MAPYLLKVCDDIYRFESASNFTDPELKRMAFIGFKKVVSGSNNLTTNSFSYSSSSIKSQSSVFIAGKTSTSGQSASLTDPVFGNTIYVTMPNIDVCGGVTCQMNVMAFQDPPFKTSTGTTLVGATISLSFEQGSTLNENLLEVNQVKVQNLAYPITITMNLNLAALNGSAKHRCVYFDSKKNGVSD